MTVIDRHRYVRSGRRTFFLTILLLFCQTPTLIVSAAVPAQSGGDGDGPADGLADGLKSDALESDSEQLLIRTKSGDLIPVDQILGPGYSGLAGELLERVREQRSIPDVHIADLEIAGTIQSDVVHIQADLKIQVNRKQEWVTVPIAFSDLHITGFSHESAASDAEQVPDMSESTQKRWHLYGAGLHTIHLKMIGKSRPQSPTGHSLNLNLPRATQSHAAFTFESPVEIQRLSTEAVSRPGRTPVGVTSIEFWGLEPAFGMSWIEVVTQVIRKPVVQIQNNRMKLDLTTIPVTLSGTQTLQISVSSISQFRMQFPPGFELLELIVRNQAGVSVLDEYRETKNQNGQEVEVILPAPTEGLLTVTYDLQLTNRLFPQDIQVRLPVLPDANIQSGDLDILIPQGLLVKQTEVEGAQRRRVSNETDGSIAATAFRMRSADSSITLHVEEIEAHYAVSPEMVFRPDEANVLLKARFPVNVLRGSLLDLNLKWPGYTGSEWKILPGTTQLVTEKSRIPLSPEFTTDDTDYFRLTFPERQSGQFFVEFEAFAPLTAIRTNTNPMICPQVASRSNEAVVITTIESDDYSLQPIDAQTSRPLASAPYRTSAATTQQEPSDSQTWILDSQDTEFWFDITSQAASVTAEMIVGLAREESGIGVHQEIDFSIDHRDISSILLDVPDGIQPIVHVAGEEQPLRATIESSTSRSYRLPTARRGLLRLLVDYLVPVTGTNVGKPLPLDLHLVVPQPQSCELLRSEVGADISSGIRVSGDSGWRPVYSESFESAWQKQGRTDVVPVEIRLAAPLNDYSLPELIFSKTTLAGNEAITRTQAVFARYPESFSFWLPSDVAPRQVLVNSVPVEKLARVFDEYPATGGVRWSIIFRDDVEGSDPGSISQGIGNTAADDHPTACVVEIVTNQDAAAESNLLSDLSIRRPQFGDTDSIMLGVWFFESNDAVRVVGQGEADQSFPRSHLSGFPLSLGVNETLEIDALLSACSEPVRAQGKVGIDTWLHGSQSRPDVFFVSGSSSALEIKLLPRMSLLLLTAIVCLVTFIPGLFLPRNLLFVPLVIVIAAAPALFLYMPQWSVVLLPYAVTGLLTGSTAVFFHRISTDRGMRFSTKPRPGDALTVFGMSGFLGGSSVADKSDLVIPGVPDRSGAGIR
ncbi:MAG: hypothetical protein KDA91_01335 [Planctomycetaceae bacterium]|nr:hypothetical protein [Planctomycetaceae bacterium]